MTEITSINSQDGRGCHVEEFLPQNCGRERDEREGTEGTYGSRVEVINFRSRFNENQLKC